MTDNLIALAGAQRIAWARAMDTLRSRHRQMIADLEKLSVGPPYTVYDPRSELAWHLEHDVAYLRAIVAAIKPVVERISDDARDYCGARVEPFDWIESGLAEITAGLINAADELQERFEK